MNNQEKTTVVIFNSDYANKDAAVLAGKAFSVEVEYPLTLNDLSLLCESVAKAVGAPGQVKYEISTEQVTEDDDL